ncbi:Ceramide glucosyltransferase-B [Lamellibrachia satsuma]|nr:Ceramide glucosyltransferase-B [Lamellibrachia satsuma]
MGSLWICYYGLRSVSHLWPIKVTQEVRPTYSHGEASRGVSHQTPSWGVDDFLENNLESHFSMTYPKFELLICVQDDQDPVITLVNKLKERYPTVECRIFMGGKNGILNPMVNNMAPAYEAARYDVIWVSTSRIKVNTDILLDMVGKLENPKVALVHQMPFCTDQQGLAASIEKVYFGATVARYYMALSVLGVSCFTGMSYLLKKVELDELHGLTWFGRFLAEDFFIAKYLHQKGFRHKVAAVPAQQNYTATSVAVYKDRMVRWMRLRLNMMPITTGFFEPLCESIPLGVYMSWSMYHFFGFNPYIWFACHWSVWCMLDYMQLSGVQNGPMPFNKYMFLVSWMIREMLFILVYFEAIFNVRHIKWGRRTYRLSNFGESIEIANDKSILPI